MALRNRVKVSFVCYQWNRDGILLYQYAVWFEGASQNFEPTPPAREWNSCATVLSGQFGDVWSNRVLLGEGGLGGAASVLPEPSCSFRLSSLDPRSPKEKNKGACARVNTGY